VATKIWASDQDAGARYLQRSWDAKPKRLGAKVYGRTVINLRRWLELAPIALARLDQLGVCDAE
jgi:hypothetical protein